MSRRRVAVLLAAVLAGLVTTVAPAGPAAAADVAVGIRNLPDSFQVGGPGPLDALVAIKRNRGCEFVRRALDVRLRGLTTSRLRVERSIGGAWRALPVIPHGKDEVRADDRTGGERVCGGEIGTAHYRITFLAGAPTGKATFEALAAAGLGNSIGRDSASRTVGGPQRAEPTPTPTRAKPTPTPTPTPTAAPSAQANPPEPPVAAPPPPAAVAVPDTGGTGSWLNAGTLVMAGGAGLVLVGFALLVFLLRRRREPAEGPPDGDQDPTLVLPTLPG
jgi:hypothetical protein